MPTATAARRMLDTQFVRGSPTQCNGLLQKRLILEVRSAEMDKQPKPLILMLAAWPGAIPRLAGTPGDLARAAGGGPCSQRGGSKRAAC